MEERLRRLLEGKVDAVIRGMRYQATQRGLKGQERKTVRGAAEYFERNRDRMKYDKYRRRVIRLAVEWSRERVGIWSKTAWSGQGCAAAVRSTSDLDLRATYLNGEWNAFWNFHVTQEDQRLYGKIRKAG